MLIRHSAVELRKGKYGSCTEGLVYVGETVGKIGEVGERSVSGAARSCT